MTSHRINHSMLHMKIEYQWSGFFIHMQMVMKLSQIRFCDFIVYLLEVVFLVKVLHNWLFTRYCMMNFSRHCVMAFSGYCVRKFLLKISYFKLSWATLCSKNWLPNLSKSNRSKTLFYVFLKISQNSPENTCAGVSFTINIIFIKEYLY